MYYLLKVICVFVNTTKERIIPSQQLLLYFIDNLEILLKALEIDIPNHMWI